MVNMSSGRFLEQLGYLFYVVSPNRTSFKTEKEVPDYVVQVVPHFVFLIILENFVLLYQGKQTFRINDGVGSVAQGLLQELSKVLFRGFQMIAYAYIYENWRLATLPWNSPWTWFICFLAVDFAYYWLHRASHEINILWAAHQVHHSSEDYNLTTALRQSVFQSYSVWIFNLPLALAIPPSVFLVHNQFNLLYQFWIHTQTISTLGPLEYILNTPSHHRVHHGRNRYCIDKNYAGTLIVWDRMFGTFEAENEEVVYGLTHPIDTFESFYVQLCHYLHIFRMIRETKGFWNKLSVIFKGPGWSPGTPWHGYLEDIPDVKAPVEKFDPHLATWCKLYVLLHFAILVGGYVELAEMKQFAPSTILWGTVAYEVFSLSVLGMLLEGRFYAPGIEVLRTFLYLAVDYFFLPYTVTYRLALWGMLSLRAIFASSFIFWLLFCLRNVTLKIHSKKLEKEQMLHELLMALKGYPGSIFLDSSEGIKVSSNIPHLHPAEKTILERLCQLGTKCKYLTEFVKKHKIHSAIQKSEIYGLYLESFCGGLDGVLCIYHQELIEMEEELLEDPFLPLTHFLKLEKYLLLFQVLCSIVSEIVNEKVHGCRILDLLYNQSNSGVSLVEMSMNKILQHCHSVMFRQVFCWMMNGFVEDPYKEFFIQPDISAKKNSKAIFVKSQEEETKPIKYMVKPELLPSYIPSSLAAKILFVGEYVSVLGTTDDSDAYSLFLKKEHIFAKKIERLLEKPVFSLLSFETTIEDIRKCAAEHLWQVIVLGANVVHHLKIMKEFYLLGRGELFLNFIGEANPLLRMPVTTTAESDASKLFQAVCRQTFPDDDYITDKFHITLQVKKPGEVDRESLSKTKLESGWSSIGLIYDVPHPLHILITPNVIDRYNMVFRFLLSVRKVQIELHQCWALQMQNKGAGHNSTLMPFWKLRSHMSFLIDNFQYYVLVDVLESCFNNLLEKMGNVKDFEEIQQYHDRFISSVISQCFLELWTVFHSLNEILDICSSFCSLMNRIHLNFNQRDISQFENLKLSFQRQTSLLFRILSGVRSHQVSPHLAQLLLRIDYNKYLSSCGGQLGGTPASFKKL